MPAQTTPITERQLDLITRAHVETSGLIEPLLDLKGGAKIKMIESLSQRGLIEQVDGQWRITPAAVAIVEGKAKPEEVLPQSIANDPELEAADAHESAVACAKEGAAIRRSLRENSKLATIVNLLRSEQGATIKELAEATGWQAHSVRGALTAAIKRRLGLPVIAEKPEGSKTTIYRIAEASTEEAMA